jgi:hypothetical protein
MVTNPRTNFSSDPAAAATGSAPPPHEPGDTSEAKARVEEAKAAAKSAFATMGERFAEIREYASYYAATKTDALKTKITTLVIYAVLGIVAGIVGLAVLATAGVMLVRGIAGALGEAFGRPWLGELVTALGLLMILAVGAFVGLKVVTGTFKKKLVAKYEQRHKEQRERFGADVFQRSDKKAKDYDRALDPTVSDDALTADEYLRRQGERAKLAIMGAAGGIKRSAVGLFSAGKDGGAGLADIANPLHIVEKRPWLSVAGAAVAGFLGMMWWHPNRWGNVRRRLAKLEKKLREHEKHVVEVKAVAPKGKGEKTAIAGIGAVLLQQALQAAKPFLGDKLGPLMAKMHGQNGHAHDREEGHATAADRLDPRL